MESSSIQPIIIDFGDFNENEINNFLIKIPRYQRPYTWTKKELSVFVDDINKSMMKNYYIGTITIIKRTAKRRIELLDGQQRLVTLSLISSILLQKFDIDKEKIKKIKKLFLYKGEWRIDYNKKFLTSLFSDIEHNINSISTFEKNIYNAFVFLCKWIENLKDIDSFVDQFLKICIIFISIPENSNPHVIFNNLNNRGISLNFSDKLKNLFLSLTNDNDPDILLSHWEGIIKQIDKFKVDDKNICNRTFVDYYKYIKDKTQTQAIKEYEEKINIFNIIKTEEEKEEKEKEEKEIIATLKNIKEYAYFLKYTHEINSPLPIEGWFQASKKRVENIWKIIFDQKKFKQIKVIGAVGLKDLKNHLIINKDGDKILPSKAIKCFIEIMCKIFLIRILYSYNEIKANKLEFKLKEISKKQDIYSLNKWISSFLYPQIQQLEESIDELYKKAKYKKGKKKNNALYDRKKLIYILSLNKKNFKKCIDDYNWEHPIGPEGANEDNCFLIEADINSDVKDNYKDASDKVYLENISKYKKSDLFYPKKITEINDGFNFKENEKNQLIEIVKEILNKSTNS
ncbi:MAG: DUF262 domain-containing protein [Mycoplasma sp.]|nr:DUF262 domain-containing protein [Mycoplasma sp.]